MMRVEVWRKPVAVAVMVTMVTRMEVERMAVLMEMAAVVPGDTELTGDSGIGQVEVMVVMEMTARWCWWWWWRW